MNNDYQFHQNHGPFTIAEIAAIAGFEFPTEYADIKISSVSSLTDAGGEHLTFLDNPKYKSQLAGTKAAACILHPDMVGEAPEGLICLTTKTPYKAYALAAATFFPYPKCNETSIHPSAVVSESAVIGKGCIIEANTVVGDKVHIGQNCHIGANVTITHTVIGAHVRIHNGARIGQDGFGFALDPSGYVPVPQLGRVIIQDNVNIGANTCIDRGAGPDTVIGAGSIIDNLVQIGHNVKIGKGCVIVSQAGISGSTEIGDYVVLGGQAGVAGHLKIGTGVQVGAQSGVTKNLNPGEKVMGFPARPIKEFWREMAKIKKLLSK